MFFKILLLIKEFSAGCVEKTVQMNVATNGVFLFYYSRQNYQKIDITIFWHLHFYKKKLCNRLHAPPFPPTHKSQIPIGGGWGSCGMQTKGTVLLVCICQRHTKRTVPLVCGLRQRLESSTPHHHRRPRWRGRWHRQKDKNRSPSAKNQTR